MRMIRTVLIALTLAALAALAVLAVVGAFGGADTARAMFTSAPLLVLWLVLGGLFVVGNAVLNPWGRGFGRGLAHVGCVAILAGGLLGSDRGAGLRKALGRSGIERGVIAVERDEPTDRLLNADTESVDVLPFALRLHDLRFQPRPQERWPLFMHAAVADSPESMLGEAPIRWTLNEWIAIPRTDVRLRVLSQVPARYSPDGTLLGAPTLEVELDRAGRAAHGLFSADPTRIDSDMPLELLFDTPAAWDAAGAPRLILRQPVTNYLIDVAVADKASQVSRETIAINRPLRYGNYFVYARQFGRTDQDALILTVAGDPGWPMVRAGLMLLGGGMIVAMWIEPAARRLRRHTSPEGQPA